MKKCNDFLNRGHCLSHSAKKFQTHRAQCHWLRVQHKTGRSDDAITAFFLRAWQAKQRFIRNILTQPGLTKSRAWHAEQSGRAQWRAAIAGIAREAKMHGFPHINFAQVMRLSLHFQPRGIGHHHAPRQQIIQRGTPTHGFFATSIHGNVAANGGSVNGSGVYRENQTRSPRHVCHPPRYCARAHAHHRRGLLRARQLYALHRTHPVQFFGVKHHTIRMERHAAGGIARATAARNNAQAQASAGRNHPRNFSLIIRIQHRQRRRYAPIRGIGGMGHTRQAIKTEIVGSAAHSTAQRLAQLALLAQARGKILHCDNRQFDQLQGQRAAP